MQDLKVIAPVDQLTEWVSQFVVAVKKSGDLRVCIDPKPLNAALKRERYQIPVIDDVLPDLAERRVFTKVDLASAFWQLELNDESSLLTTFATPHGRYRWLRLPFGLCVSNEIFQKQERAWGEVKRLIASAPVLAYYKPGEPLEVQCDSSQAGLGAALMQNGQPIAYASRALKETETRYAYMEKEMLAIVFAVEKFNDYTFGNKTIVYSDQKPLESILKNPLHRAPKRLQGMKIRLQKYDLEVRYEKGKQDVSGRDPLESISPCQ